MENEYVITFTISCNRQVVAEAVADMVSAHLQKNWKAEAVQFTYTFKPITVYLQDEEEADNGNA
jgi:hypothetical protein